MGEERNIEDVTKEVKEVSKENKRQKRKLFFKNCLIVVLIIIIILLLMRSCSLPVKQDSITSPKIQTGELYEQKAEAEQTSSSGRIFAPAVPDFTVSKTDNPYVNLFSPEENKNNYLIKYTFTDTATGEVIYDSDYLEGGFKYSVDFASLLDVGEYDVKVQLSSKDANTFEDKNGTVSQIVVTVVE